MKKLSELLAKCSQFEELASFGIEPMPMEHPVIPRPPPIPMEFRPTEIAPPATVPGALWDTAPTDRTPATPTMRSPEMRPPPVDVAPEARPATPTVEPTKPGIKASDIKFDENGNVVVPQEWYNEKGKLTVDKRQLAKAIYDARKAKIVSAKLDAARAKTLSREMSQVNGMVKSIAFREKLPARAAVALLSAAALTAVYFSFSGKKPTTTDPVKTEVATKAATSSATSSLEKPTPVDMSASIRSLKDSLLFIRARTPKEKAALQSYSSLLDEVNSSIGKLAGTSLNLDSTPSASTYASEVKKFDMLAVNAIDKLQKLQNIFRVRNDTDGLEKAKKVIDGLSAYVVAIDSARSIRAQG
jgi:hypothetical protein